MLSSSDKLYLRKFLTVAYDELDYPEARHQAEVTVRALASPATLPQAVTEFVHRCNLLEQRGGIMGLRADAARDILAHHISHTSNREAWLTGSGLGDRGAMPEGFWETYERRYAGCARQAAREAESLRLLDCCDPATLFSFYGLPEEGAD